MAGNDSDLARVDIIYEPVTVPRYCPRCDLDPTISETSCHRCGESLRPRGYCDVCEQFWRKDIGEPCPKHELPLEHAPPPPVFATPGAPGSRWVTLETYPDETAAEARRLRLEAEGIPTFLSGARMGSRSMYLVATGGVKLQVPAPLANDARVLLSQTWTPPQEEELEDAWDELAPDPGAFRRRVMKRVILFLFLGPFLLVLIDLILRRI